MTIVSFFQKFVNHEEGSLISEFHSEETKRSAFVYQTPDDYRIVFLRADEQKFKATDWRESLRLAEEAAEDWVLGESVGYDTEN